MNALHSNLNKWMKKLMALLQNISLTILSGSNVFKYFIQI